MEQFRKYLGTLISTSLPHEDCGLTDGEILALVKSRKALLARYTSDSQIFSEQKERPTTGWWHCVRTEPIDIATLTAKQRYRVRRGLERNDIFRADAEYIMSNADALYHSYGKSIEDYLCDGERNIRHQTSYQDFLVTVLGFRKAPCRLNIVYHPLFKVVVKTLYPFRRMLLPFCSNKLIYNAYCLLFQEQCARECDNNY